MGYQAITKFLELNEREVNRKRKMMVVQNPAIYNLIDSSRCLLMFLNTRIESKMDKWLTRETPPNKEFQGRSEKRCRHQTL